MSDNENSRVEGVLDAMVNETETAQQPQSRIETLLLQLKQKIEASGGKIPLHICEDEEYDPVTGIPTIEEPSTDMFYMVPSENGENNLYTEWIYTEDGEWEQFGKDAPVEIPQSDWEQTTASAPDYIKNKPPIKKGSGNGSILEGLATSASGEQSHAEGRNTKATGNYSHAEGYYNEATKPYSHAEGSLTQATGDSSHAEGGHTIAAGDYSHSEGFACQSPGRYSHAEGLNSWANGECQHVFGKYNNPVNNCVEIVGNGHQETVNGETQTIQTNARTLDWNGNEWLSGNLTAAGGTIIIGQTSITEVQLQALLAML